MDTTANLGLPYIIAAQAQKHVTHNEALRILDNVVQLSVASRQTATPPAAPTEGTRYIVGATATGAWSGQANKIAAWQDGTWAFLAPSEGWIAWLADENLLVAFDGSSWINTGGAVSLNPVDLIGVATTADTTNKLAVASPASLFTNSGAGHQLKINKAGASDTASVLLQTGYSGRAELGLTGNDDFHFKVSPDGSTWREAIVIDRSTGQVTFPNTSLSGGGAEPGCYYASAYSILPNGSDMTAALNALLATVYAAGGGTIVFDHGTYVFAGNIVLPNDNPPSSYPRQPPLRLVGAGAHNSMYNAGSAPNGGTILAFSSAAGVAHLDTRGLGALVVEHLTMRATANTALPFIQTTNTTIKVRDVCFWGFNAGAAANNDAVVLGGTANLLDGSSNAAFQGYGSVLHDCFGVRIRRLAYMRRYANDCVVQGGVLDGTCGGACAVEIDGNPGGGSDYATGNRVRDLTVETTNYTYVVKLAWAISTAIERIGIYDLANTSPAGGAGPTLGGIYLGTNAGQTTILPGLPAQGYLPTSTVGTPLVVPQIVNPSNNTYLYLSANGQEITVFPGGIAGGAPGYENRFHNTVFDGGAGATTIQPATVQTAGASLLQIKRSAAEASDAGASIFDLRQDGSLYCGNASASQQGNYITTLASAASWTANGRTWAANGSGGHFTQFSGSGGGYFYMRNYAAIFTRWDTNAQVAQIGPQFGGNGLEGLGLGTANDVAFYRKAAGVGAFTGVVAQANYTVATLPTPAATMKGAQAFATNGRKSGEGAGAGTGIPVWCDGAAWKTFYDNSTAAG